VPRFSNTAPIINLLSSHADISRKCFENSHLVHVHPENSWKAPSSCLWSSKAEITGKVIVNKWYGQCQHKKALKAFFVHCLNVSEPSLEILVEELKSVAEPIVGRSFSVEEAGSAAGIVEKVKILIKAINSMPLDKEASIGKKLRSESIFPVKLEKLKMLKSTADYFSIIDRQKYHEAFKNEAWILDFSLEEVHELRPFLRWLNLEERYLSCRVIENSTFGGIGETCSDGLTQDLRFRAKALLRYVSEPIAKLAYSQAFDRCAVHFQCPSTQGNNLSLFRLISEVRVYQSDDISSLLELSQIADGKTNLISVCSSKSKLHIDQENKGKLRVYVPRDEKQRLLCYQKLLPEKMLSDVFKEIPGSVPSVAGPNAVRVLATLLNVPRDQEMLDELLEDFGIRQLPKGLEEAIAALSGDEAKLEMNPLSSSDDSDDESGCHSSCGSLTSMARSSKNRSSTDSLFSTFSNKAVRNDNESSVSYSNALRSNSTASIPHVQLPQAISSTQVKPVLSPVIHQNPSSLPNVDDQEQYKRLLGRIINAAKEADIPTRGAFNMNALVREIVSIQDSGDDENFSDPSYTNAFGDRSVNQLKHDMKIGVAGELFVSAI
jgi:hypothetical protein